MKAKFYIVALICTIFSPYVVVAQNSMQNIDSMLCIIHNNDQKFRLKLEPALAKGNPDSILDIVEAIDKMDSENQQFVFNLLDNSGWPSELSDSANNAIFLVIDHAELDAQKKYYHFIEEQANKGKVEKSSLATLHDRILMRENKKQVYGTQTKAATVDGEIICWIWPIENAENVDKRRAEVGLSPIADYLKVFEKMGLKPIWDKSLSVDDVTKLGATIIIK